jgi:sugar O-acyltransferase (sialic acid O-acetyltransferase NeuD family)
LFAEEIADLISEIGTYELASFVEGINPKKCQETLCGLPIIWIDDVEQLDDTYRGICAVGSTKRKVFIQQARAHGLKFTKVVHPTAQLSRTTSVGEGTIINAGAIIAARSQIGQHVIINRGCLIGHHVEIGDYATISPGANIAGKTKIGESSYIAMGAVVLDGISIGSHSIVAAGAIVTRDVPDWVQVVGVPARVVKHLKEP